MKAKWTTMARILIVLLLALAAGMTLRLSAHGEAQAQDPQPPQEGGQPQGDMSVQATVDAVIPIQGRLTDARGDPLNGDYTITTSIYDVQTLGTALCADTQEVTVNRGLFTMNMRNCTSDDIDGRQLYLGIKVGGDEEMVPRQPIYPVPYAMSLMPGSKISYTPLLWTGSYVDLHGNLGSNISWHLGYSFPLLPSGRANYGVRAEAGGGNRAYGVSGYAQTSANNSEAYGLYGSAEATGSGSTAYGVYGYSENGIAIKAAGSGIIQSTADTQIAVSPLKMVPRYDANIQLMADYDGKMEIRPNSVGTYYVIVPVDLPNLLYGTPLKLKSIQVCYQCDNSVNFIDSLYVGWRTDSGFSDVITDFVDRKATSWTCYTVVDSSPEAIAGPVYIDFGLKFNLVSPPGPDIQIGKIILTLTEQ